MRTDAAASSSGTARTGTNISGTDDLVPVAFGAVREKPSPAQVRAVDTEAARIMSDVRLVLPLSQRHDKAARGAASTSDSAFSWRTAGFVSPARDQGDCGSCWVFAAVAALESSWAIGHNKSIIDASEQHVLNCAPGDCSGGRLSDAMQFLVKKGTCKESDDGYEESKGPCTVKPATYQPATWKYVDGGKIPSVSGIKKALLERGPLAVFIYSKGMNKKGYFGSDVVITDNPADDDETYNHFVLIVGWDDTKAGGKGAWEIKNSWRDESSGTWWGRKGFGYVAYDVRSVGENAMWVGFKGGFFGPFFQPQSRFGLE